MTATQARLHYDAIANALAVAGAQLTKASPALATLVHLAPQTADPAALAPAQVHNGQCVFSVGFTKFSAPEAAVALAHVGLHLILGHDQKLQQFLTDVPTGNARLFNAACDLSIAHLLSPLTTPPRMPLTAPANSLNATALEIALAPMSLEDIVAARRLGLDTPFALLSAPPEAIYLILSAMTPIQRGALLGAPGARPLSDDLRPAAAPVDRVAQGANDNLTSVARHLCAPLAQADASGVVNAVQRRLEVAPPDWRLRLRAMLEAAANPPGRTTFARPDHRQASRGKQAIYMPGRAQPKRKPIVAIIDPHAAIARRHIDAVLRELARLSKARPSRIIVVVAGDPATAHELPRSGSAPVITPTPKAQPTDLEPAITLARTYAPEIVLCVTDLSIVAQKRTRPAPVYFSPARDSAAPGRHIEIPFV